MYIHNIRSVEGWMRLSLYTPDLANRYPKVLDDNQNFPNFTNLNFVDTKNATQMKPLDNKLFFEKHRLNTQFGKNPNVVTPDSFYFRYTKDNIFYYAETEKSTIIL